MFPLPSRFTRDWLQPPPSAQGLVLRTRQAHRAAEVDIILHNAEADPDTSPRSLAEIERWSSDLARRRAAMRANAFRCLTLARACRQAREPSRARFYLRLARESSRHERDRRADVASIRGTGPAL